MTKPDSEEDSAMLQSPVATADGAVANSHTSCSYLRSLSHISEGSADGVVLSDKSAGESGEVESLVSLISINDIEMEMPSRTPEPPSSAGGEASPSRQPVAEEITEIDALINEQPTEVRQEDTPSPVLSPKTEETDTESNLEIEILPESGDVTYVARRVAVEEEGSAAGADCLLMADDRPVDCGLEDALGAVVSSLDDYRGQFPELQLLEQELKLLQVTLKVRTRNKLVRRKLCNRVKVIMF